ncbi:MAG: 4'-phosphopantetheinyl transferase superfamily protein [Thermoguttaceae bacterium]|nr:4'-phosphopantetheinyl transferase superfamily protein [Thermoguttaceae bacterium]MDW8078861.1 4'-phosphopantetheinyl transferase superfamily protein [Thermoguttaceae bacterium]
MRTSQYRLAPEELHIWLWETENPVLAEKAWGVISGEESERARRFRHQAHRIRFLCTRVGLRSILSEYLRCAPAEIRFAARRGGKPVLEPETHSHSLRFNLAHSAGLAALALRVDAEVGIDLEAIRPMPNALALAERFFSPAEAAALRSRPNGEQEELFFRLWTCKEAVLKGLGFGLTYPLDQVEIPWLIGDPVPPVNGPVVESTLCVDIKGIHDFKLTPNAESGGVEPQDIPKKWWVWEFKPHVDFFAAVASSSSWNSVSIRHLGV